MVIVTFTLYNNRFTYNIEKCCVFLDTQHTDYWIDKTVINIVHDSILKFYTLSIDFNYVSSMFMPCFNYNYLKGFKRLLLFIEVTDNNLKLRLGTTVTIEGQQNRFIISVRNDFIIRTVVYSREA